MRKEEKVDAKKNKVTKKMSVFGRRTSPDLNTMMVSYFAYGAERKWEITSLLTLCTVNIRDKLCEIELDTSSFMK